jgi:lipopolysaccharide export LptBFGC system permease protein LptF
MKKTALMTTLLAFAAGIWLTPTTRAWADEEKEAQTKIPATAAGILQAVMEQETELGKTIADKKLDDVHHHAFAIRDLVNALPEKSSDLAAEKLTKLKANAKFVTALAGRLDESGDAKDQAGTESNFKKLQDVLKQIRSLYPSDTSNKGMDDMPGMQK